MNTRYSFTGSYKKPTFCHVKCKTANGQIYKDQKKSLFEFDHKLRYIWKYKISEKKYFLLQLSQMLEDETEMDRGHGPWQQLVPETTQRYLQLSFWGPELPAVSQEPQTVRYSRAYAQTKIGLWNSKLLVKPQR